MKTVLAIIGAIAVSWILFNWFRLVWFRARALAVITNDLHYNPSVPGLQSGSFNAISRSGRTNGWNEYDVAIAFMLVQLGVLPKPLTDEAKAFYVEKLGFVQEIAPLSTVGDDLILEFKAGPNAA